MSVNFLADKNQAIFIFPLSLWERVGVRVKSARYLFSLIFPLILTFSPWEKGTTWASPNTNRMKKLVKNFMFVFIFFLTSISTSFLWAWTVDGGGDHGGVDWTLSGSTTIAGYHYNIGDFTVSAGATVYIRGYDGDAVLPLPSGRGNADNVYVAGISTPSGFIEIEANVVTINGLIEASGRGYRAGNMTTRGTTDGEGPGKGTKFGSYAGGGAYGGYMAGVSGIGNEKQESGVGEI